VKPVNTQELLRQIESLLASHSEHKLKTGKVAGKKINPPVAHADHSRAASKKAL
jgi:hypothetical protein